MKSIHSSSKHVLLIYFVLGTGISVRDSEINKTRSFMKPQNLSILLEKRIHLSKSNNARIW